MAIEGGLITRIGTGSPPGRPDHDFSGFLVAPGFIDIHVHGGGGRSFEERDLSAAGAVVAAHRKHGTTTMLASLVSAPVDDLLAAMQTYRPLVEDGLLAGIHLEGPFLSNEYRGAHASHHLRPPEPGSLSTLLEAGRGVVSMVTLAPELAGGVEAVRAVRTAGIVAAIGHTGATYEETMTAIEAGVTVATHLCNGMPPVHHRFPGPVIACLEDERVSVELIADGIHLHSAVLAFLARAAGPRRVILVSDAIAAAGSADGTYILGDHRVEVRAGRATLAGTETLAGSTLTLDAALRHAVGSGIDLVEAVAAITSNPARSLGLADRGELGEGRRADLVVLSSDLHVQAVMAKGQLNPQGREAVIEPVPDAHPPS